MEILINITTAAQLLGVHSDTLRNWDERGTLKALRTPGGHRRYRLADIEQMQRSDLPKEDSVIK